MATNKTTTEGGGGRRERRSRRRKKRRRRRKRKKRKKGKGKRRRRKLIGRGWDALVEDTKAKAISFLSLREAPSLIIVVNTLTKQCAILHQAGFQLPYV